jgi:hypothetical protein
MNVWCYTVKKWNHKKGIDEYWGILCVCVRVHARTRLYWGGGCNKMTYENAQSYSEHCVEEAGSWNDHFFLHTVDSKRKDLLDRLRCDQGIIMYYIILNIRQLSVWGDTVFPVRVFRGENWENLGSVIKTVALAKSFIEADTKLKLIHITDCM